MNLVQMTSIRGFLLPNKSLWDSMLGTLFQHEENVIIIRLL